MNYLFQKFCLVVHQDILTTERRNNNSFDSKSYLQHQLQTKTEVKWYVYVTFSSRQQVHLSFHHPLQNALRQPMDLQCAKHPSGRTGQPWPAKGSADAFPNINHDRKYIT